MKRFLNKVLTTSQPDYLHNLISVQSSGRTRSSSVVTLARPSVSSSLQITNRSFRYASPRLWNQAPFFIPSTLLCSLSSWFTSSCAYHLITVTSFTLTIYQSLAFHSRLKPRLFHKSFPLQTFTFHLDCFHTFYTWTRLSGHWRLFVLIFSFFYIFWWRVLDKLTHHQLFSPR